MLAQCKIACEICQCKWSLNRSHLKELDETQLTDIQALKSTKQDNEATIIKFFWVILCFSNSNYCNVMSITKKLMYFLNILVRKNELCLHWSNLKELDDTQLTEYSGLKKCATRWWRNYYEMSLGENYVLAI